MRLNPKRYVWYNFSNPENKREANEIYSHKWIQENNFNSFMMYDITQMYMFENSNYLYLF